MSQEERLLSQTLYRETFFIFSLVGDASAPTIENLVPAAGETIAANTVVEFDVIDNLNALRRVLVLVTHTGKTLVVHDGDSFYGEFSDSVRTPVAGGYHYEIERTGGWLTGVRFRVAAIDTSGNEA
jgi:hypothetical protein